MKRTALALAVLVGLAAAPALEAQGRGRGRSGIPPGHWPPPGDCRVWFYGVPPGQQPPPTSCREAERIAWRVRDAWVIYGDDRPGRDGRWERDDRRRRDGRWERDDRRRDDDRSTRGRAVPRGERYPGDVRYPDRRYPSGRNDVGVESPAFASGYRDGAAKGREDIRDGDRFDPDRHRWYRSADRGYNKRYGSREAYRAEYREGFLRGYDEAYDGRSTRDGRRPRLPRAR